MAFESIVLSDTVNYSLSRIGGQLIAHEAHRCSGSSLYPQVTQLEPPYISLCELQDISSLHAKGIDIIYDTQSELQSLCRCDILPSSEYEYRWDKADIFLRHLPALCYRCGFEIIGNCKEVKLRFLCDKRDIPILSSSFCGKFTDCAFRVGGKGFFDSSYSLLKFRDYYTPGPYSHLLTQPAAFKTSAYETFLYSLSNLPEYITGFCQVLFKATKPENNWHKNIEMLTDVEYIHRLMQTPGLVGRNPQQLPSGDLQGASTDIDTKSHPDKPFFAAALRIGILGSDSNDGENLLPCLSSFIHLFQHGSRPLEYISSEEYGNINTQEMFEKGLVYHPGMLLNSTELSGLVHVPSIDIFKYRGRLEMLSPLFNYSMGLVTADINAGTLIGHRQADFGQEAFVIPHKLRRRHCHIIGNPGKGKSVLISNMVLNDIEHGHGVGVIDPHGDLIEQLLDLIPEKMLHKTILFDPGDDKWIPLYNPLDVVAGADLGVAADNVVSVLKSVFSEGWGYRMEHILKNLILALLHVKGMSFLELTEVLRRDTAKSKKIIEQLKKTVTNGEVLNFLEHDFQKYRSEEFTPALHRLSPLVSSETKSLPLLQSHNRFDFKRIMDEGMIFLANLSSLGRGHKKGMGGFLITSLSCAVNSRYEMPEKSRKLFNCYVDEGYLFNTDATEGMLIDARKYNVSFNISHQYLRQFKRERVDSLLTAGTTIAFGIGAGDAAIIKKNYQNKVKEEEFQELGLGEAIVRVDTDIAKIKTLRPRKITKSCREQIIQHSHKHYYKPSWEILKTNRLRFRSHYNSFSDILPKDLAKSIKCGKIGAYEAFD